MQTIKKNQWSIEEDKQLGQLVVQAIQEGKTMTDAGKVASNILVNRTPAACINRWSTVLQNKPEYSHVKSENPRSIVTWTEKEDYILASTVLESVRQGKKLNEAIKLVVEKLRNRTHAACSYRFNNVVIKDYKDEYEKAKKEGLEARNDRKETTKTNQLKAELDNQQKDQNDDKTVPEVVVLGQESKKDLVDDETIVDDALKVAKFVQRAGAIFTENKELKEQIEYLNMENKEMQEDNKKMKFEIEKLSNTLQSMREDYNAVLQVIDLARQAIVLEESATVETTSSKFKMERNGNLTRI